MRLRKRRNVLNDTSTGITIHEIRKEISEQFEQLMPTKYCKSSEKVCPAGPPPDILVPLERGDHVAGDQKERKVLKVPWDLLENPEKQE